MRRQTKGIWIWVALVAVVVLAFNYLSMSMQGNGSYTYQQFEEALSDGQVVRAVIHPNSQVPTGEVVLLLETGEQESFYVSDVTEIETELRQQDVPYSYTNVPQESKLTTLVLPLISIGIMVILLFAILGRSMGGGGNNGKMMNFGKSRARMSTDADKKINFGNVAGLEEEKEDLQEIVDFLKHPQKYNQVGARIPKGVLLVGPPGTGKTLMAKAVAGEAGVPFFSISGSDFVEMFVGVGASRVRDLFEEGKRHRPCIIFIDEIDAVARRRGTGMGGGHDEREQTLNQLLVEMDGFGVNEGIIVMAATNRVDILDPAILRPGRFDRRVLVGAPDVKGRE